MHVGKCPTAGAAMLAGWHCARHGHSPPLAFPAFRVFCKLRGSRHLQTTTGWASRSYKASTDSHGKTRDARFFSTLPS